MSEHDYPEPQPVAITPMEARNLGQSDNSEGPTNNSMEGPRDGAISGEFTDSMLATTSASFTQGTHWKARGPLPPQIWVPPKRICDCDHHHYESEWPVDNATIVITACAIRCPYCSSFNVAGRKGLASDLRRHILLVHIQKDPTPFQNIEIAPGRKKAQRN